MKKNLLLVLTSLLLTIAVVGCGPADPNAAADDNNDIAQTGTLQNGRMTLPNEALKISTDQNPQTNAFYVQTQGTASSVVKDYFFTSPGSVRTYNLQFDGLDYFSCDANPAAQFYLISDQNAYTSIQPYISFQLNPNTNYRLEFRSDNLNCYGIKVIFALKQL